MHTNLVCTASLQATLHKRNIAIAAQNLEVSNSMLTIRAILKDIHLQAILGAATYITDDSTLVLSDVTPHKGYIAAVDGVVKKLLSECRMSTLILCNGLGQI